MRERCTDTHLYYGRIWVFLRISLILSTLQSDWKTDYIFKDIFGPRRTKEIISSRTTKNLIFASFSALLVFLVQMLVVLYGLTDERCCFNKIYVREKMQFRPETRRDEFQYIAHGILRGT